jgi:hypothetical protein
MEGVVAPLLHNNVPVNPDAVNMEFPQLFVAVTTGVGTTDVFGAALALPGALVHAFTV